MPNEYMGFLNLDKCMRFVNVGFYYNATWSMNHEIVVRSMIHECRLTCEHALDHKWVIKWHDIWNYAYVTYHEKSSYICFVSMWKCSTNSLKLCRHEKWNCIRVSIDHMEKSAINCLQKDCVWLFIEFEIKIIL